MVCTPAGCVTGVLQRDRRLVADCPVRAILVVVSAPSLQLFARVRKGQEPVGVHALGANTAVEGFGEGVVGRLARSREVERDAPGIGPDVEIAGEELAALVDADRRRVATCGSRPSPPAEAERGFAGSRTGRASHRSP